MKKFWIMLVGYMIALVAISVVNNVVLLNLHPLGYYYTLKGMAISWGVGTIETIILLPISWWFLKYELAPVLQEGLADKQTEVIKESLES